MYIPKNYLTTDKTEIIAFMRQFSFATIITAQDNIPTATHLPFSISEREDKVILASHFARANKQWEDLTQVSNLIIFTEPHAYISPKNYEKGLNVPTWNYIAVHAYGTGQLVTETEACIAVLEQTILTYEPEYKLQWDGFPEDYKLKMLKGIVAFEIEVTDLQAKQKLSQNKTVAEQHKIIENLAASPFENERIIADYMQKNLAGNN